MNRLFEWIFAAALVLLTIQVASAYSLHYTNWGGGISPSTWGYGTTATSYTGDAFRASYYQDHNTIRSAGSATDGSYAYSFQAARPTYTTSYSAPDQNYNYRTWDYGNWQLGQAQMRGDNWGFYTTQGYNGLTGSAYYGGYGGYRTGPYYGSSTHLYGPYNQYGSHATYYPSQYGSTYGSPHYYSTTATTISRGNVYY